MASGVTGASPSGTKGHHSQSVKMPLNAGRCNHRMLLETLACSLSGLKAPDNSNPSCSPRYEYFLKGTIPPPQTDDLRRDIAIFVLPKLRPLPNKLPNLLIKSKPKITPSFLIPWALFFVSIVSRCVWRSRHHPSRPPRQSDQKSEYCPPTPAGQYVFASS